MIYSSWCHLEIFSESYRGSWGTTGQVPPSEQGSAGEVPKVWRKQQWCCFGMMPCIQKAAEPICGTYRTPELELWAGWLQGPAATPAAHWDLPQGSKAPQLNLVLQTGLFLTHKGSKTGENPAAVFLHVLNSCFPFLHLREFKHFSYQIILKLVRHQVFSTVNTAPCRNLFRGQEECLWNVTASFEAHKMNWRVLRCAEGVVVSLMVNSGKSAKVH